MENKSKEIVSNQNGIHEDLIEVIEKYKTSEYKKPFSFHTVELYREVESELKNNPLILDLGCGTGESSNELAQLFPNHLVIGIDKSEMRIGKTFAQKENLKILRGDFVDFVRLMKNEGIKTELSCLFYPNPWPKKHQFRKRIHAHPFFGDLINLSKAFTSRTNWEVLALETKVAVETYTGLPVEIQGIEDQELPLTKFERKYKQSGHKLWEINFKTNFSLVRNENRHF